MLQSTFFAIVLPLLVEVTRLGAIGAFADAVMLDITLGTSVGGGSTWGRSFSMAETSSVSCRRSSLNAFIVRSATRRAGRRAVAAPYRGAISPSWPEYPAW